MIKKTFFTILSFLLVSYHVFCATYTLSMESPDSQEILNGELVSEPVSTENGFTLFCEGRMMCAIDTKGKTQVKKLLKGRVNQFNSSYKDFTVCVLNKYTITLINPSLQVSWQVNSDFDITQKPYICPDGRIYTRGKTKLQCHGLNSVKKWSCSIAQSLDLPLTVLDDSSILINVSSPKAQTSIFKRIDKYGNELTDIVFAKKVTDIKSVKSGFLAVFDDTSYSLYSFKGDEVKQRASFTVPGIYIDGLFLRNKNEIALLTKENGLTITFISENNGKVKSIAQILDIDTKAITEISQTKDGVFVSDDKTCYEINSFGKTVWSANLPGRTKWNYITYTNTGYVLLFLKDWFINTYKIRSITPTQKKSDLKLPEPLFNDTEVIIDKAIVEQMKKDFTSDNIAAKEKLYLESLYTQMSQYKACFTRESGNTRAFQSIYITNPLYTQDILDVMACTGTTDFNLFFSEMIKSEDNADNLTALIKSAGKLKYDIDGQILDALYISIEKANFFDETNLMECVCDTVYEICAFMGKETITNKGRLIMTKLVYPQYNKKIREYAKKTMGRLVQLDL